MKVDERQCMHHSTFSVSHPGSFLKTLGGMRVDHELVRSRWQLATVHDGRLTTARNMEGWRGASTLEHTTLGR